ncbi:MAG: restriction endonuclease [Rhodospirillales bacterium]
MPIPSINELKALTVQALVGLGGSARNQEIFDEVARLGGVTEDDQNQTNRAGQATFYNRLATAKTYLKNDGKIVNSATRVWALAPGDVNADQAEEEAAPAAPATEEISQQPTTAPEAGVEEDAQGADEEGNWKQELLATLMEMDPHVFERLCQRLLRESGFESVEVTGRTRDGGIDGFGVLQVNLVTFRIVFECKRHSNNVSAPIIQAFRGAMDGRGEKGLVITTASFTSGARKEAARLGALSIDLVDGDRLCDLLKDLKLGVSTEMVERVNIDRDWFLRV